VSLRATIKNITPGFLIDWYKSLKSARREKERKALREKGEVLTAEALRLALKAQAITEHDHLMVHSSLSKLGYVEGGADMIVDVLQDMVGKEGNLLMPSFPVIGFNYDFVKTKPVLDVKNTLSRMGIITEVFRLRPGVKRSMHPTDPVCVYGKDAEWYVKDHFGQLTPYNAFSPFKKLADKHGKILLLGVKLETVTNFHTPEDAIIDFKYPVYHREEFELEVIDENGQRHKMRTKVHNPEMSKRRRCNDMEEPFLEAGVMKKFTIGKAVCYLIDAAKMHHWLVEKYREGVTIYEEVV
jgi:aminoglycoside 3-N-acetyltransferase